MHASSMKMQLVWWICGWSLCHKSWHLGIRNNNIWSEYTRCLMVIIQVSKIGQGVFELQGSKNWGLPLTWPVALTTVQPRAGSGAVSKWVICACDSLVDFGTVWMWLISIFVLLTFPVCIFPSSFFMRLTFSSIFSSISYLPEYWTRSVSRQEVVGGDQTWV